jgi:transposase
MANVLSEQKRQQVVALGRLNWSLRQIQEAVGVRRETAGAYLKAAGIAIRTVRGRRAPPKPASRPITDSEADSKPASQAITDLSAPPPPAPKPQPSRCEPYRQIVEQALSNRRNGVAIYQELVDTHGFGGSYSSVRRFVRKLRDHGVAKTFAVIHTAPGEEAQVDYGTGPMVRHPESGTYRRTRLFVLTLGFSRKCVRFLVWRSSSRTWADLHEKAFRRLGGGTRVMVLDNLKEGVLTPDIYDPELNPLYRDMLAHYGVVALPCRIRNPDRKGKVERGVGHAQETPLKGLSFESLEEAQAHLDHWEERWADTRIHGTTKRQVAAMFAEEKPHLRPLPVEPFRYYEYGTRTVHLDGHVEVARAYYSVPPGHVGRVVWVQWDSRQVRILSGQHGQLLREHSRQQPGRHRTAREDRPAPTPRRLHDILGRACRAGERIGTLCRLIHEREGDLGSRRILGVIALVKRFGPESVEDACAAALEIGTPTYRFVRRYVERQPSLRLTLKQIDPLIRELTDYRDLIDRITNNPPQEEP